jgi:hypothetical protein
LRLEAWVVGLEEEGIQRFRCNADPLGVTGDSLLKCLNESSQRSGCLMLPFFELTRDPVFKISEAFRQTDKVTELSDRTKGNS